MFFERIERKISQIYKLDCEFGFECYIINILANEFWNSKS